MKKTKPQWRGLIGAGVVMCAVLGGGIYLINSLGADAEGGDENPLAPIARAFGLSPKDYSPPPLTSPIPDYRQPAAAGEASGDSPSLAGVLDKVDLGGMIKSKEEIRRGAQESVGAILGVAQVIDGDTIDVAGQRIRLYGIDAPELGQNCIHSTGEWDCGRRSALWLQQLITTNELSCISKGNDRYGRIVATCTMGDLDIAAEMVSNGWALAYRSITKTYAITEGKAKRERLGLWDSKFANPWDFRQEG
ncbi:thermonuclease family protein [Pseudoxanthomonas japonensis]|uniref:thermonuclease family protein n=1 Tax=Pseudoxanthomonas japonensis TaxID=69284 RepID=UPI00374A9028